MDQNNNRDIEQEIAESIIELPITFMVGSRRMEIRPKTLGQDIMLRQYQRRLGIDAVNIEANMLAEAMRIAADKPEETARVIAIYTMHKPEDIKSHTRIDARAQELLKEATTEDLASLLVMCWDADLKIDRFMQYTKLDKDKDNIRKISEVKNHKNVYTFNGKTVWGQLIGTACERFGWTMDYVLWGISLTNLQMLMADQMVTMTLTDEERRRVSLANVHDSVRVDDPANAERVRQIIRNIK